MENAEQIADYSRRIKEHQAEVSEREEAIKHLKAKIVELVDSELGDYVVGDNDNGFMTVNVYQHKVFNAAQGKKTHPELWEKAKVTTETVTAASAKAVLDAEEYAYFQKPSADLSVKIEVVNNDD